MDADGASSVANPIRADGGDDGGGEDDGWPVQECRPEEEVVPPHLCLHLDNVFYFSFIPKNLDIAITFQSCELKWASIWQIYLGAGDNVHLT